MMPHSALSEAPPVADALPIPPPARPGSQRLESLDVFRGATVAAMILVNNGGTDSGYWPLKHAAWNGWTPTDLIFPFFVFIVGVSLVFSFEARLKRGDSRVGLLRHTAIRAAKIFLIGLAINATVVVANWIDGVHGTLRIPGVLQRIAIAYLAAAILVLYTKKRTQAACAASLLLAYWLLMRFVPVPGHGMPTHEIPLLHPDWNLAAWLDRRLMHHHLYERTRDPEGLLSTLPAIATVLFGVLTGDWLRSCRTTKQKVGGMLALGVSGLVAGSVWDVWFPINKKLWTSSFALFTAGFALILLATLYYVVDVRGWKRAWTKPFLIFGMNAITAYALSEWLGILLFAGRVRMGRVVRDWQDFLYVHFFAGHGSPEFSSLLFAVVFLLVCFLPVWWMYRKKIFLKV